MKKLLVVVGAAAAGFVAGILMAPKSGKETREDIKAKTAVLKGKADKQVKQARAAVKDGVESAKATAKKAAK